MSDIKDQKETKDIDYLGVRLSSDGFLSIQTVHSGNRGTSLWLTLSTQQALLLRQALDTALNLEV